MLLTAGKDSPRPHLLHLHLEVDLLVVLLCLHGCLLLASKRDYCNVLDESFLVMMFQIVDSDDAQLNCFDMLSVEDIEVDMVMDKEVSLHKVEGLLVVHSKDLALVLGSCFGDMEKGLHRLVEV